MIDTTRVDLGPVGPPGKLAVRSRNGKKFPFAARLKMRVAELFYSVPSETRRRIKIPQWYSDTIGVPKYYFRAKGNSFTPKQACISTLGRLYFLYRFLLRRGGCRTSTLLRGCRDDSVYRLFQRLRFSPRWYAISHMIYRRLKVLIRSNLS